MRTSLRSVFLSLLLLLAHLSRAQEVYQPLVTTDYADVAALAGMPLDIVEAGEDPAIMRYLQGDKLVKYRAALAIVNAGLREAGRSWQFSPQVVVHKAEELDALRQSSTPHLVLYLGEFITKNRSVGREVVSIPLPAVQLGITGKEGKKGTIHTIAGAYLTPIMLFGGFWDYPLAASDVLNPVQQMQRYLDARKSKVSDRDYDARAKEAVAAANATLPSKTLLLDQALLAKNLPAADVAKLYPYPVQVVDRATIEAAVLAADARYLYPRLQALKNGATFLLIDMATGMPSAATRVGVMHDTTPEIQPWVLKAFAQSVKAPR